MIAWFAPDAYLSPFSTAIWSILLLSLLMPPSLGFIARRFPPRHYWVVILWGLPLIGMTLWLLKLVATQGRHQQGFMVGPLTLEWQLDGLSGLLLLLTQLLVLSSAAYATAYQGVAGIHHRQSDWLWPLLGGLASALTLIWIAADLVTLYAALEAMGLCTVALMLLPGKTDAQIAGMRYLLYGMVGSLAWLLGMTLLLGAWGRLDLAGLALAVEPGPVRSIAVGLFSAGLLLKAAVFPLHTWLAPVHRSAWTPVSAVHASLVVKASFFILLKLWLLLVPNQTAGAWLLGVLGGLAVVWGGLLAWRASGLKELVAFSTVGQLGYLMLAFPLLIGTSEAVASLAWQATWLQLAGHALAKAAIFMAAGNLVLSTGRGDLAGLAGTSRRLPLSLLTFGLAAVSLMGFPPSAGFSAKWLLLQASILSGQWIWVVVLVVGALLSAAYLFRVFRYSFIETAPPQDFRPLPPGMDLIAFLLAFSALGLGLVAEWPLSLLRATGDET